MQIDVSERKIVVIQKFCFHGNVTSHFSSLFDHLEREWISENKKEPPNKKNK